jgi:hypothetical protein
MKRLTVKEIISGIVLLLILVGTSFYSPSAASTPIIMQWRTTEGIQKEGFDLGDPVKRAEFLVFFKDNDNVIDCAGIANYAVELMEERDAGTSEEYHLEVMKASYENTKNDPDGIVPWHIYVDFQRLVHDLHRFSGGQFFFTDPYSYWEREFRWCFVDASNWPNSW